MLGFSYWNQNTVQVLKNVEEVDTEVHTSEFTAWEEKPKEGGLSQIWGQPVLQCERDPVSEKRSNADKQIAGGKFKESVFKCFYVFNHESYFESLTSQISKNN